MDFTSLLLGWLLLAGALLVVVLAAGRAGALEDQKRGWCANDQSMDGVAGRRTAEARK